MLYAVLPELIFADSLLGAKVRGRTRINVEMTHRWRWNAGDPLERKERLLDQWRRHWTKERVKRRIGNRIEALKNFAQGAWWWAYHLDPLRDWEDLVLHVSWEEREKLRGDAFTAHLLQEASQLASHLLAFVEGGDHWRFSDPEGFEWMARRLGGPLNAADAAQKEFICNRFGLNPSPRVFWFVEGQSEERLITTVSKDRGDFLNRLAIRVLPIRGVGELDNLPTAIETARKAGSLVFTLVDRGDRNAIALVERLKAASALDASETMFSDPTLEQANFSDEEVAAARERMRLAVEGGRIPANRWNPSKPNVAEELTRSLLLPEIASAKFPRPRPILDQIQEVIDAAVTHGVSRPHYHPNLRAKT